MQFRAAGSCGFQILNSINLPLQSSELQVLNKVHQPKDFKEAARKIREQNQPIMQYPAELRGSSRAEPQCDKEEEEEAPCQNKRFRRESQADDSLALGLLVDHSGSALLKPFLRGEKTRKENGGATGVIVLLTGRRSTVRQHPLPFDSNHSTKVQKPPSLHPFGS